MECTGSAQEIAHRWYTDRTPQLMLLAKGRVPTDWDGLRREVRAELVTVELEARLGKYLPSEVAELMDFRDWVEDQTVERFFTD